MGLEDTLTLNGFVVQGQIVQWVEQETRYRGVALRESWPLDKVDTPKAKELTQKMNVWFYRWYEPGKSYSLWMCPDVELTKDYCNYCLSEGIDIRVLVCKSRRSFPKVQNEFINNIESLITFQGYDYVSVALDYSTISDDLFHNTPSELEKFRKSLNDHGLFFSWKSLEEYIEVRNILIHKGEDLESSIDCCKIAVYLFDPMRWW